MLSTFSLLIASLITTNERNTRRIREDVHHNVLTHENSYIKWLPWCGAGFGSYKIDVTPHTDPLMYSQSEAQRVATKEFHEKFQPLGNGNYEPIDCNFFTWGRQCMENAVIRSSRICSDR